MKPPDGASAPHPNPHTHKSAVPRVDLALNVGDLVKIASPRGMDTRLFRIHKKTKKGFEVRPVALLGWKTEKGESE